MHPFQPPPKLTPDDLPYRLIVACGKNNVIGKGNSMPWRLPEDLKYFKKQTMGKIMLMGGNTYRSFPRPLPDRYHLVISRQPIEIHPMVVQVGTLAEAHIAAQQLSRENEKQASEIMVIGGAQVYAAWLPLASAIDMTEIDAVFDGDAFFPQIDETKWKRSQPEAWKLSPSGLRYRRLSWQQQPLLVAGSNTRRSPAPVLLGVTPKSSAIYENA